MPIDLTTTSYGLPAAQALHAAVRAAKASDPLRPVTIVVPSNYVGVSMRRLLASGELGPLTGAGAGVVGLTFVTVFRLAELLGAARLAATGRRPVSTPVIAAAIRRALATAPGMFGPVREHPSTEEAFVAIHGELAPCSDAALDAISAAGHRAAEVVRIHRLTSRALAEGWYDETALLAAAGDAVASASPVLADLGDVIVHLPQDITAASAALLTQLADRTTVHVIAGLTGDHGADRGVVGSLGRLGLEPPGAVATVVHATEIVSVSDADEEVRTAVARVVEGARQGVPLERMAILFPTGEPYARIVHEQLAAAGVEHNGRAVRPLADRMMGRWLLDVLALPSRGYRRNDVLGLLSQAPVRTSRGYAPTTRWDRVSREAGVVGGLADWDRKLTTFAAESLARSDLYAEDLDAADWRRQSAQRDAADAEDLRSTVRDLAARLNQGARLTTWAELAAWAHQLLTTYLDRESYRSRWPDVERRSAEKTEAAIDRLGGLDGIESQTDLDAFRRTLQLELDDDLGRVGRFGVGVLIGTPAVALGVDLDVVVVLGLAEGVFPAPAREDSLLSDAVRRQVPGELVTAVESTHAQHRRLLAALASARQQRVLVHPRGDLRRSAERATSRWVDAAVEPTAMGERASRSVQHVVPSFAGRVHGHEPAATAQEARLRILTDHVQRGGRVRDAIVATADPVLTAGLDLVDARSTDDFGRFDGNLAHVDGRLSITDARSISTATKLQAWMRCPHAYFMQYVLKVRQVEVPEQIFEMGHLDMGNLVHVVLERWLDGEIAAGVVPSHDVPWSDDAIARLVEVADACCLEYEGHGVTGHPLLWRRDRERLLRDLRRLVVEDDVRRHEQRSTPTHAEFGFGAAGDGSVVIDLGDGRAMRLMGKVDRVERTEDGKTIVLDYKSGGTYSYSDISDASPLGDGTKLQLALYALALRAHLGDVAAPVRSDYWFVTTKGGFRIVGYDLTDAHVAELQRVLRVIVDNIDAGVFPLRPSAPVWKLFVDCAYCDPDGMGTSARFARWRRIASDASLRDYVNEVAPDLIAGGP